MRMNSGKKLRRHPEALAAQRRASKDRPQALASILRDAAQVARLLRMTVKMGRDDKIHGSRRMFACSSKPATKSANKAAKNKARRKRKRPRRIQCSIIEEGQAKLR
jgi:hypothetical protein